MKKYLLTVMLISSLFLGCQLDNTTTKMNNINTIIEETRLQYAPDKRTALFDVSVDEEENLFIITGETNLPEAHQALINRLENENYKPVDQVKILPEADLGDKVFAIVRISVANIRSNPGHSAELATQALLGTVVKVLKKKSYWYLVQTPDNYLAWVDASGIERVDAKTADDWISKKKIFYLNDFGYAYSTPRTDSERVSDLVAGDLLEFLEENFDYYKVKFPDGRTAFIPNNEAQAFPDWLNVTEPTDEGVVSYAKRFIGVPYLWGGTSTKAMDCSGFTKTVYFMNGVVLQRDASQQVHTGNPIETDRDFSNLLPGDLLFFGRAATDSTTERITHVGIYIGNTEFIHASGLIKINSLNPERENFNKYRYDSFVRARRPLTSLGDNKIELIKQHPSYVSK